jgi:hypothetical protein
MHMVVVRTTDSMAGHAVEPLVHRCTRLPAFGTASVRLVSLAVVAGTVQFASPGTFGRFKRFDSHSFKP